MRAAVRDANVIDGDMRFCLVLPREPVSVPLMRRVLGGTLLGFGADAESVADLLLAATEACTNVLRHGDRAEDYQVCASMDRDTCLLEIANGRTANGRASARPANSHPGQPNGHAGRANGHAGRAGSHASRRSGRVGGHARAAPAAGQPAGSQDVPRIPESGRGIAIMRACVDDLTLRGSEERGTVVSMRKRIAWAAGEPSAARAALRRAG